jgi:outer membrane protein OmpA-like peptidoglycan-associated protein
MKTILNTKSKFTLITLMVFSILFSTILSSCHWNKTAKGGAIGAAAGGAVGGAIGSRSDRTVLGAIIGAAVGGAAGAAIGRYMDKQAEELQRDLKNATVERVGEGIKITFDSGILFDVNSYQLKPAAKTNIQDLAKVLQKYEDTNVLIEGHTDNTGEDATNQTLSEKRADAVKHYASTLGVATSRISTAGYGEGQPVADNASESGRSQNRRVEIAIMANKKLQKAAEKGEI